MKFKLATFTLISFIICPVVSCRPVQHSATKSSQSIADQTKVDKQIEDITKASILYRFLSENKFSVKNIYFVTLTTNTGQKQKFIAAKYKHPNGKFLTKIFQENLQPVLEFGSEDEKGIGPNQGFLIGKNDSIFEMTIDADIQKSIRQVALESIDKSTEMQRQFAAFINSFKSLENSLVLAAKQGLDFYLQASKSFSDAAKIDISLLEQLKNFHKAQQKLMLAAYADATHRTQLENYDAVQENFKRNAAASIGVATFAIGCVLTAGAIAAAVPEGGLALSLPGLANLSGGGPALSFAAGGIASGASSITISQTAVWSMAGIAAMSSFIPAISNSFRPSTGGSPFRPPQNAQNTVIEKSKEAIESINKLTENISKPAVPTGNQNGTQLSWQMLKRIIELGGK